MYATVYSNEKRLFRNIQKISINMLAKISLAINAILIVGFLYLYSAIHKSGGVSSDSNTEIPKEDISASMLSSDQFRVAYVNVDSLFANYEYIKDLNVKLKEEMLRSEQKIQSRIKGLEKKFLNHQEKSAYYTQKEIMAAQQELQEEELSIQKMQEELSNDYLKMEQRLQIEMIDAIHSWLEDYNKLNRYDYILSFTKGGQILYGDTSHNITQEVVTGLNQAYQKEQEAK
jgi:outer membrane protein